MYRCTLFALIFLAKLIHAAVRFACDSGPTCFVVYNNQFAYLRLTVETLAYALCRRFCYVRNTYLGACEGTQRFV